MLTVPYLSAIFSFRWMKLYLKIENLEHFTSMITILPSILTSKCFTRSS